VPALFFYDFILIGKLQKGKNLGQRALNARSYAEQTLKVQTGAGPNGLPWNYWKINYYHQLEREGELLRRGFLRLIP